MTAGGPLSLAGLWGFPLTPFTAAGTIDEPALEQAVRHQIAGGIDVLAAVGTIAERDALSARERARAAAVVVGVAAATRTPVLVTVGPEPAAARAAAEGAAALGAAGLLVLPPPAVEAAALARHLAGLAAAGGLPLVVYQRGDLLLEPDDLRRLVEVDALTGVKDGQGDLRRFRRLRDTAAGRLTFVAAWEDMALPYWAAGADAFAPASVAHDPWYARAWLDRLRAGDVDGARVLLGGFAHPFSDLRRSRRGIDVAAVKLAMELRGLRAGPVRPPWVALEISERTAVAELVARLDRLQTPC